MLTIQHKSLSNIYKRLTWYDDRTECTVRAQFPFSDENGRPTLSIDARSLDAEGMRDLARVMGVCAEMAQAWEANDLDTVDNLTNNNWMSPAGR